MFVVQGSGAARYETSLLLCPRGARRLWWRAGLYFVMNQPTPLFYYFRFLVHVCFIWDETFGMLSFQDHFLGLKLTYCWGAHPTTKKHGYCQLKATSHPQWFLCVIVRKAEGLDAGTETASNLHQKLYYHRLGTDQREDVLFYEAPDEPKWMFGAEVTDDGKVGVYFVSWLRCCGSSLTRPV
jgi:hypothetical protein